MSFSDLTFSSPSSTGSQDWDEVALYEPASTLEAKSIQDTPSTSASDRAGLVAHRSLDMVKHDVKAPRAPRSGLLATELKRVPAESAACSSLAGDSSVANSNRKGKMEVPSLLETVNEVCPASLESTSSTVQLPSLASPASGLTSPLAVPAKRQHTNNCAGFADDKFVPPHILAAQTLPSNFVYAEDARPGSVMEGIGRKLRGSDAARFRASVMRQTGFLEPQSSRDLPAG